MEERRIVRSVAESLARLHETRTNVASSVDTKSVSRHLDKVSKPNSPSSTLKKAGVALIVATPDPITAVPGVALIAASYATKRKEPTKLDDLAAESRRILRDIQSLRL
jgi:hypothetical protein